MVIPPLLLAAVAAVLGLGAEALHARRVRRVAALAFGPALRPRAWARTAPLLRVAALGALAWGLATLIEIPPRTHSADGVDAAGEAEEHIVLVLDVSPSMRLIDAGPEKDESRMRRARALLDSFFGRVPLERYRISVIAVYNGAKPVVVDTSDMEVVRNILGDLPMHYAFTSGKTRLLDGIEEAVELMRPWPPRSAHLILVSDGDSVPATGMPRLPASVASALIVGVGDPLTGKFIDGRQSRQDVSALRQIAVRLSGEFHNGNEKHLPSELIAGMTSGGDSNPLERLTRREYALIACALGGSVLALLPALLRLVGTSWRPGAGRGARREGASGRPAARRGVPVAAGAVLGSQSTPRTGTLS